MRITQARRTAYRVGSLLGDVRAAQTGRVRQRLVNKALGRVMRRATRRWWL